MQYLAVVKKVVTYPNGDPRYVVCKCLTGPLTPSAEEDDEDIFQSVTFSIESPENVWAGSHLPDVGDKVVLGCVIDKANGWRALEARPRTPEDGLLDFS